MQLNVETQRLDPESPTLARAPQGPLSPSTARALLEAMGAGVLIVNRQSAPWRVRGERRVDEVERALAWLDAGRFGRCSVCAAPIEEERMASDPAVATCLKCMCQPVAKGWMLY